MNLHSIQHVPFESLGSIESWASSRKHKLTFSRCHVGDPCPSIELFDWLIILGGPMSVHDEDKFRWLSREKKLIRDSIDAGKVVLGICLGAQLIADVLGARVRPSEHKEIGWFPIRKTEAARKSRVLDALPPEIEAFHWHGETFDLPAGAIHGARSEACENQAFVYRKRVVGLQFHLETTPEGVQKLVEQCGTGIEKGPFVQEAESMLSDAGRFERIHQAMARLLNALESLQAP